MTLCLVMHGIGGTVDTINSKGHNLSMEYTALPCDILVQHWSCRQGVMQN